MTGNAAPSKMSLAFVYNRYGGGEQYGQPWPIEQQPRPETPYVTTDMYLNSREWYGGVSESYWVSSTGLAVVVGKCCSRCCCMHGLLLSLPYIIFRS